MSNKSTILCFICEVIPPKSVEMKETIALTLQICVPVSASGLTFITLP